MTPDTSKKSRRGFAAMDKVRQREIASQGGRAAHASGRAHEFTVEEARAAGRKRQALKALKGKPGNLAERVGFEPTVR